MKRRMKISPHYDGERFFTVVDGVKMATPLFVVIALHYCPVNLKTKSIG